MSETILCCTLTLNFSLICMFKMSWCKDIEPLADEAYDKA